MSAYITVATPMIDQTLLLAALADVGFGTEKVLVGTQPIALVGFEGSERAQAAHVVIRRQHLSGSSNDLGFVETATGYRLIVSDYDRSRFGATWMASVSDRYRIREAERTARLRAEEFERDRERKRQLVEAQRVVIEAKAKKLGYSVNIERQGEGVRLVLVRRSY